MPGLSKSTYTKFCQCDKMLWLKTFKPDLEEKDESAEERYETGHKVGDLAKGLFGPYVDVTTLKADGSHDKTAMINKTKYEMGRGTEVICEASFSYQGCYCAVDILRREGGGWAIYEVKSSSSHSGDEDSLPKDFDKYVVDVAFQRWVLEQCGIKVTGVYLVTINGDYVRDGDLDIQQLFRVINIQEKVDNEYPLVPYRVMLAKQVMNQKQEPDQKIGPHCSDPYPCGYWHYCAPQQGLTLDEGEQTVFEIYRLRADKKWKYFNAGIVSFEDVRNEDLKPLQRMQVECTLGNTERIDRDGIREFLDGLTFPLYFLDFETIQPAIPLFKGTSPYEQIPFQYSLHILEREGGQLIHKEYLAPSDGNDPRRGIAEHLCQDIPTDVCTLAFNKRFECGRLNALAYMYSDKYPDL